MPSTPTASAGLPFAGILREGDTGTQPVAVKRGLFRAGNREGWDDLDGAAVAAEVLGPIAVVNLEAFQRANGLTADGVYGPKTHALLVPFFDAYARRMYIGKPPVQLPFPYVGTHKTSGLDWPGLDAIDIFAPAGTRVLAPLAGTLRWTHMIPWSHRARVGGLTTYLEAAQGTFFLTHFGDLLPSGAKVRRGQDIGSVGAVPSEWWPAHIHMGFRAAV